MRFRSQQTLYTFFLNPMWHYEICITKLFQRITPIGEYSEFLSVAQFGPMCLMSNGS